MSQIHTDLNTNKENTNFQFLRFDSEITNRKLANEQRNKEYQLHKLQADMKFKNRFSKNKSNNDIFCSNIDKPVDNTNSTSDNTLSSPENLVDNLKLTFISKMEDLQKAILDLKLSKSNHTSEISSKRNSNFELFNNKHSDQQFIKELNNSDKINGKINQQSDASFSQEKLISEAECRLEELEQIFNRLKQSKKDNNNSPVNASINKTDYSRKTQNNIIPNFQEFCTINQKLPNISGINKNNQHVNQMSNEFDEMEKLKMKENYANELRMQIEDSKLRKKQQLNKEMEEDKIKAKEMKEYDQLGQRITKKATEEKSTSECYVVKSCAGDNSYILHARGGNGIFGEPLTEAQKSVKNQYNEELNKQIFEKSQLEELRKQIHAQEDLKEILKMKSQEENNVTKVNRLRNITSFSENQKDCFKIEENDVIRVPVHKSSIKSLINQNHVSLQTEDILLDKELSTATYFNNKKNPNIYTCEISFVSPELLFHLNRLRSELESEKFRIQLSKSLIPKEIKVFDPRSDHQSKPNTKILKGSENNTNYMLNSIYNIEGRAAKVNRSKKIVEISEKINKSRTFSLKKSLGKFSFKKTKSNQIEILKVPQTTDDTSEFPNTASKPNLQLNNTTTNKVFKTEKQKKISKADLDMLNLKSKQRLDRLNEYNQRSQETNAPEIS